MNIYEYYIRVSRSTRNYKKYIRILCGCDIISKRAKIHTTDL